MDRIARHVIGCGAKKQWIRKAGKWKRIKPIRIMHQDGLPELEKDGVLSGIYELLKLAGVQSIPLFDAGVFRAERYKHPDGSLKRFASVDWYIYQGKRREENNAKLRATEVLFALCSDDRRNFEETEY